MTLFIRKMLLVLPLGLFVLGVNLWVDPASLFHQAGKKKMAACMLEGKTTTNLYHHDKRQAMVYYVAGLKEPKKVLVLGSSRAMVLDASLFPETSFFNAAVPAGDLEDLLASYEIFHEAGKTPGLVILGPEPYMLNGRYTSELYLKDEYEHALKRLGLAKDNEESFWFRLVDRKYRELLSPDYFQESFGKLPQLIKEGRPIPEVTDDPMPELRSLRADGSLIFDRRFREAPVEKVNEIAVAYVTRRVPGLTCFPELDAGRKRIFETFVESLLDEGVKVIFLLPPFHPITYDLMMADREYRMIPVAQAYFTDFAKKHGIPVYGSYNPKECGCTDADFVDGHHPKPEALMRVFREERDKAAAEAPDAPSVKTP